jgi:hypothetical protein
MARQKPELLDEDEIRVELAEDMRLASRRIVQISTCLDPTQRELLYALTAGGDVLLLEKAGFNGHIWRQLPAPKWSDE